MELHPRADAGSRLSCRSRSARRASCAHSVRDTPGVSECSKGRNGVWAARSTTCVWNKAQRSSVSQWNPFVWGGIIEIMMPTSKTERHTDRHTDTDRHRQTHRQPQTLSRGGGVATHTSRKAGWMGTRAGRPDLYIHT